MRKLMLFTIGFTIAVIAGVYWLSGLWAFLLGLLCCMTCAALFVLKTDKARITFFVTLGIAIGMLWVGCYQWFYLDHAKAYDGKEIQATILVDDYSFETDYGITANGRVELTGKSYKTKFYLNSDLQLEPGDRVDGTFRFRFTADGGEKGPTYHQGKGIFLLAYERDNIAVTKGDPTAFRYFAAVLRRNITDIIDRVFPDDTVAFARALLLGDSSLLTYEQDVDFQITGIRHVIAVSGLHVSILFSLLVMVFKGRAPMLALFGFPLLFLFAAVAGFTPSIIRACVMQGLIILAILFARDFDPPTALSAAVLTMLVVTPHTVTSVSFQLSVGCTIGIFLFNERISGYLLDEKRFGPVKGRGVVPRLKRWLISSVSVSASSMITTIPLCAYYFGTVSLVSVFTNLLTLWCISYIFYGIMASCVLGAFFLPLGTIVAWIVSWLIRYVQWIVELLGAFPLAAVYTKSVYIVLWLVFSYILLVVFARLPKKQPIVLCGCVTVLLCASLIASWMEPKQDQYRFSVLDVGQGQCLIMQSDDRCYMVDCGGDSDVESADQAAAILLSQGITRLDGLIITHYDKDHAGGALLLLQRISVNTLYLPTAADESGIKEAFEQSFGDRIQWISEQTVICYGESSITIFPAADDKTNNESSLCVLFQPGNYDILITGDRNAAGERALLEEASLPKLELLVVGHHGSNNSTSLDLLSATQPAVAVISVSKNNSFGHPSDGVLNRLRLFGCVIYRTDTQGTIVFKG